MAVDGNCFQSSEMIVSKSRAPFEKTKGALSQCPITYRAALRTLETLAFWLFALATRYRAALLPAEHHHFGLLVLASIKRVSYVHKPGLSHKVGDKGNLPTFQIRL